MKANTSKTAFVNLRGRIEAVNLIPEYEAFTPRYEEVDFADDVLIFIDTMTGEYVGTMCSIC